MKINKPFNPKELSRIELINIDISYFMEIGCIPIEYSNKLNNHCMKYNDIHFWTIDDKNIHTLNFREVN